MFVKLIKMSFFFLIYFLL